MNFHQFLMGSLNGDSIKQEEVDLNAHYCPTLLIGLGGTGANVLLRVKKLLQDRLQGVEGLHRFLYIDTDTSTFAGKPGLPAVEGNERCLIGVSKARAAVSNPDYHEWLWKRFPRDELKPQYIRRLVSGNGASQIRSLGAAGLALDYREVKDKIATAHNDLLGLAERKNVQVRGGVQAVGNNILVYIVGSLAGGTGSGCFVDVAMIAQDVCQRDDTDIVGMFAIANRSYEQKVRRDKSQYNRMRSNTYAALKELQYIMDAGDARSESIIFPYGSAGSLELKPYDELFKFVYLIDDRNQLGTLPTLEEMYDLMARTIFQDVGSVLGAAKRSFDSNVSVASTDPCMVTGLNRMFGSVATTSICYPAERVATYTTLRGLHELLVDEIIGTKSKEALIKNSVSGFLANEDLEERGSNNRVLERLLEDDANQERLSIATDGLNRTWGSKRGPQEYADRILSSRADFVSRRLPAALDIVRKNYDVILGTEEIGDGDIFKSKIEEYALDVASKRGIETAVATLSDLEETCEQMTRELEDELRSWTDKGRPSAEQALNEACIKLKSYKGIKQYFSKTDDHLKASLISQYNNLVENDYWAVAKPRAIQVMKILKSRVTECKVSWVGIHSDIKELVRELSSTYRNLETHVGGTAQGFVVAQEVTTPGYEQRYYKALGKSAKQFLPDLLKSFAARQNLSSKEASTDQLHRWMFDLETSGRPEQMGKELAECLFASVAPPLLSTNVVNFVKSNPKEVGESLGKKLDLMYSMCQPFWPASPPRTDQAFSEFIGLTVKKRWDEKSSEMVAPAIIKSWAEKHSEGQGGDEKDTIHTNTPYEIVLSRRTYGARAFYLNPVMAWKPLYDQVQKTSKNGYMTETHCAFINAPDPMPADELPLTYFTLGVALGFIVTRGDWYYFALELKNGYGGQEAIKVLFDSQSETVFSLSGTEFPKGLDGLVLSDSQPARIQNQWKLGQGRENAAEILSKKLEWTDLLQGAVEEYHRSVGNSVFAKQIEKYRDSFVAGKRSKDGNDIYSHEYRLLTKKITSIGK